MHYFWPCFHCACTEIVRPAFLAAGETSDTCKFGLDVPLSLKAHYFGGFRTFAVDFFVSCICKKFAIYLFLSDWSADLPCGVCSKGVGSNSIQCTSCQKWVHKECSGIRVACRKWQSHSFAEAA